MLSVLSTAKRPRPSRNCLARWKRRGRDPGVRGTGSRGMGPRGVENTGSGGKHGAWKTRGLEENTGCGNTGSGGKHGVWWKRRGLPGKHKVLLFLGKI